MKGRSPRLLREKISFVFDRVERVEYVRSLFGRAAPRYDAMNRLMSVGRDRFWRRRAVGIAELPAAGRLLDLGIGTGDLAVEILARVPGCRVVGLDNCSELTDLGRVKPRLGSVKWRTGDGRALPFPDCSFDGVLAAFSIRNMPDLPKVFSEIHRVLVPGGKLVILEMVQPTAVFARALFRLYIGRVVPVLGRFFGSDPEAYLYLFQSILRFYTSSTLRRVLGAAGFEEKRAEERMLKIILIWIGIKEE
jgi:demethylmenaquinone methyltransferase / 2-methoxy-6-polyprenyl-1,4-benzoquinol methylase